MLTDVRSCSSAEEAEEDLEDGEQKVNNIVNSFRLTPTSFDKKSFLTYLKVRCLCGFLARKPDFVHPRSELTLAPQLYRAT